MFEIVITKKQIKEVPDGKEWERTGRKRADGGEEYAYTPEITRKKEVETLLLKQNVEELDLAKVIRAINNLE
jgi:hypothetical protein